MDAQERPTRRVSAVPEPQAHRGRRVRRPARASTRVLLVVDDALHRHGLRALLESQPDLDVVGEAHDCREAAESLRHLDATVILLDPRGLDISPAVAMRALSCRALLVLASSDGEPVDEVAALRAGASGLLLTTASPAELAAALRVVGAGYTLHRVQATDGTGREATIDRSSAVEVPTEFRNLTPREQQVFRLLAAGFGNAEIAELLSVGESTIKSHVQHLLTKLDIPNRVHAVIYAYRHGLVTGSGRPPVSRLDSSTSAVA